MHVSRSFTRHGAWDRNNYVTIINGDHKADAVPRHICQNEENVDIDERDSTSASAANRNDNPSSWEKNESVGTSALTNRERKRIF